ncbi:CopG family transcriptional regulator [Trichocoleus sp. FACHB-90]|uniref:CopG family transcriptional regulator n=1 Tax=Cyanophyceae TaxID=3028117 RepID=UPI0016825F05|nr:CopG family transcriptional regulator [Trichocoleus sp. FACHB-90]MBD1925499.1 CopG family transcriptional regulator [Trichocoleus sp. FACHB-90]
MSKRLDLRLPEEDIETLEAYCKATGATKTGTIRMLLQILKDERLLAIVRKSLTVD